MNYPRPPASSGLPTHVYFVTSLKQAMKDTENVPDLACKMMHKIADLLIAVAIAFRNVFMEPYTLNHPTIYYNLDMYPSNEQLMNISS